MTNQKTHFVWSTKTYKKIIFVVCVIILIVAHIFGYKIYGTSDVIDNQPLKIPQKLQTIDTSGQVVLDSGKKYKIYGIKIITSTIPFG